MLIGLLAVPALALPYDAFIWNEAGTSAAPNPLTLNPGDSMILSYRGENIAPVAFNTSLQYNYSVVPLNAVANPADVTVTFAHPNFVPTTTPYTDVGVITLSLNAGANPSALYRITIEGGDELNPADLDFGSASRNLQVPEFPTIALPIAAILGLVFIFGRKKEGL